jgi:8-oxo-dGTP diphosphatase
MPGHFWKYVVGVFLYLFFLVNAVVGSTPDLQIVSKNDDKILTKFDEKTVVAQPKNKTKTQSEDFRFFKKECSIVTSIIVRVYKNGKFEGFLLIDRGRPPLGPALPGGMVKYGEAPEDCVKRTLFDECGIKEVSNIQQFNIFSDPVRDPRMHAIDLAYLARIDDQKISSSTDAKHAYVCSIEAIPWNNLKFDHASMLKIYIEYLITSKDTLKHTIKIQLGSTLKSSARNKNDFENIAKQAYRPPHMFVAGIVEIYENDVFKGIAISDFRQGKTSKILPCGKVAYGETVEQALQRHMRKKYHSETDILCPFKSYSFFNETGKKHDITTVFLTKTDKKNLGTLQFYPLDEISKETFEFHHKDILEDYLKYRKNEKVDTCTMCIPLKTSGKAL